jgi:hypothetical protein
VRGQAANRLREHRGIDKSMLFYIKAACIHGYNARRFRKLPEDVSVVSMTVWLHGANRREGIERSHIFLFA